MATKAFKVITELKDELRYTTADRLEEVLRPQLEKMDISVHTTPRGKVFGAIMRAPIKCKDGKTRMLKEMYAEPIAIHITNLTISRLTTINFTPIDVEL